MPTTFEKEAWIEACSQVRDDKTDINWAALKHDGNNIVPAGQGVDYEEVKSMCTVCVDWLNSRYATKLGLAGP